MLGLAVPIPTSPSDCLTTNLVPSPFLTSNKFSLPVAPALVINTPAPPLALLFNDAIQAPAVPEVELKVVPSKVSI